MSAARSAERVRNVSMRLSSGGDTEARLNCSCTLSSLERPCNKRMHASTAVAMLQL